MADEVGAIAFGGVVGDREGWFEIVALQIAPEKLPVFEQQSVVRTEVFDVGRSPPFVDRTVEKLALNNASDFREGSVYERLFFANDIGPAPIFVDPPGDPFPSAMFAQVG